MFIQIAIKCDDEKELITHLRSISSQVKELYKTNPTATEKNNVTLRDSNCYGDHVVVITEKLSNKEELILVQNAYDFR